MRRALLTTSAALPTFTVGNPATTGPSTWAVGYLGVASDNPAPAGGGTITTVKYYATTAGNVVFATGSGSSTSFTVAAVTGTLAAVVGLNTFTVSLAIPAGGRIAEWSPSSGGAVGGATATTPGSDIYYAALGSAPTAGSTYSLATAASTRLSLQGLGS